MKIPFYFLLGTEILHLIGTTESKPPHIIIIVIDDLGWSDVPWNNPDSWATYMGQYASEGIILDRHYVHTKCSPSRAALLTGRYAWKMGRQRGAIERFQPTGLSTKYELLPQMLKRAGYSTNAVGKWHLGYCNEDFLPTRRGFDTFFGLWQQSTNYRSREIVCSSYKFNKDMIGYDLRRNESVSYDYNKMFAPNMYSKEARKIIKEHDESKPLFLYLPLMSIHAPLVDLPPKRFRKLINPQRKMGFEDSSHELRDSVIASVDFAVHKVFLELKKKGIYNNSVILVTTDNGGGPPYSNTPLKGTKETMYEGGIRGVSFIHSPLLNLTGFKYSGLMHITDWVPTLLGLAGVPVPEDLDGYDVWNSVRNNKTSQRNVIIHNIDEDPKKGTWQATMTSDKWKLIWGQEYLLKQTQPLQSQNTQLYNIMEDPNEIFNQDKNFPEIVVRLKDQILKAKNISMIEADYPEATKKGWPRNFDGFISSGWCESK
eukprot:TRINITY_DN11078_c0_g1_i1.p1 TRINITY_DN11078_c0_g1~~TRINITY_DN11078_c0_g1_i1.p1  ORF type:complete len:485 (-),score=87.39 TRINITY_DN11078_c0_g1_i1:134-1588(-)